MNRGLRRVEKLVDATNSTLAQIKSSLTFDDWNGKPGREFKKDPVLQSSRVHSSRPQELQCLDGDLKSSKMLSEMEKLLISNKTSYPRADGSRVSRVRHKMKELNEKVENLRSEKLTAKETKQSRQNLFRLVNKDFHGSGAVEKSQKDSERNKQISFIECERRLEKESLCNKHEPEKPQFRQKSKEELKSKILETQEIVDRGFHTARELTQKVENMSKSEIKREKTPGSESTVIISELTDLKSLNRSRRSRSSEERSYGFVRSRRRSRRHIDKEKKSNGQEKKNALVKMKRADWREAAGPHLKFQRLPSLHIKGELQLQTIHNLEILPENSEPVSSKTNTAINIFSHEKIEKEKKKKILEDFEKENRCSPDDKSSGATVKCSNCGKLIKMPTKSIDSREIDKVLLDCDFNVFDPRIEEFVEKWNEGGGGVARSFFRVEKRDHVTGGGRGQFSENKENKKTPSSSPVLNKRRADSEGKRLKIEELIEELSHKYKERVNILEDDHLRLESILRNLYDKVSQSKKFFHVCKLSCFPKNQKVDCRKVENLSATTPLVICLASDADVSDLSISKPSNDPDALTATHTQRSSCKKGDKKVEAWEKRSMECGNNGCRKSPEVNEKSKEGIKRESRSGKEPENLKILPVTGFGKHNTDIGKKNLENKRSLGKQEKQEKMSNGSRREAEPTFGHIRVSISEKTENDYESDFEGESLAGEKTSESQEENYTGFNNILTVSRANSEFEKTFNHFNKRKKYAVSENYLTMFESKKEIIDGTETSKKEKIRSGKNEDGGEDFNVKVDYTLQDQRKGLKTPRAFQESIQSMSSPPSANADFTYESGHLKAKSRKQENSVSIKNDLLPESERAERRKSRSEASSSRKSSSTQVVASLKEILTAMEDQFVKTQLLADKLTENVKDLSGKKGEKCVTAEPVVTRRNAIFSCNLSLRNFQNKNEDLGVGNPCSLNCKMAGLPLLAKASSAKQEKLNNRNSIGERSFSAVNLLWKEEVSSAGEVNVNNLNSSNSVCYRKLANCEKSGQNSDSENRFKRKSNRRESCQGSSMRKNDAGEKNSASSITLGSEPEGTYSDGEIENEGLSEAKCFSTHSVGELISEIVSASSITE